MEAREFESIDQYTPPKETGVAAFQQSTLLGLNKASIKSLSQSIISEVMDGNQDGLEVLIATKKAKKFFEEIEENLKGYVYSKPYASKGEILKIFGTEVQRKELGVKWNYDNCGDVVYNRLKQQLKDREAYLKAVLKPVEETDEDTGEVYTIYPPVKTSTDGYEISIK